LPEDDRTAVLMCGLYTFLTHWSGRAAPRVTPRA
jgi:hypothetical protein